ncbi:MAG: hypothetical protein ABIY70_08625 [Capsulimonas sp.]|uniref:hypothetical protein n=1 Tax=Capsulimonas sp. TaxID=2494211 RepID=UPI003265EC2D
MPYDAHPTGGDLKKFWDGTGIVCDWAETPFNRIDLDDKIKDAVALMESGTGRKFIAQLGTRTYDPPRGPRGFLSLGQDLCSDPDLESSILITAAGAQLTLGQTCFLGPENSDNDGLPWSLLEISMLGTPAYSARRSVSITGYWGYSARMPDDVWSAELAMAALAMAPQVELALTNGVAKIEDVVYASGSFTPLSTQIALWRQKFDAVVANKKKVVI